jgi:hypothetical protein
MPLFVQGQSETTLTFACNELTPTVAPEDARGMRTFMKPSAKTSLMDKPGGRELARLSFDNFKNLVRVIGTRGNDALVLLGNERTTLQGWIDASTIDMSSLARAEAMVASALVASAQPTKRTCPHSLSIFIEDENTEVKVGDLDASHDVTMPYYQRGFDPRGPRTAIPFGSENMERMPYVASADLAQCTTGGQGIPATSTSTSSTTLATAQCPGGCKAGEMCCPVGMSGCGGAAPRPGQPLRVCTHIYACVKGSGCPAIPLPP